MLALESGSASSRNTHRSHLASKMPQRVDFEDKLLEKQLSHRFRGSILSGSHGGQKSREILLPPQFQHCPADSPEKGE
jgi:ribosomal protein L32